MPLRLSYWVLAVAGAVVLVLLLLTRDDRPSPAARWRPRLPHVPTGTRWAYADGTLSVCISSATAALVLALGAQMARELTGTTDLLVTGSTLALFAIVVGLTALAMQRVHSHVVVIAGAVVSLASLALMQWTASSGSFVLFLAFTVVSGVGYSLSFSGGIALVGRAAPAEHRGSILSAVYLPSYLVQALTAIAVGALASERGLVEAIGLISPAAGLLCVVGAAVAVIDLRRPVGHRRER